MSDEANKIELVMSASMEGVSVSYVRNQKYEFPVDEAMRLVAAGFGEPTDRKTYNAIAREREAAVAAAAAEAKAARDAERQDGAQDGDAAGDGQQDGGSESGSGEESGGDNDQLGAALAAAGFDGPPEIPADLADADSQDGIIAKKALVKIAQGEGVEFEPRSAKPAIVAAIVAHRAQASAEAGDDENGAGDDAGGDEQAS